MWTLPFCLLMHRPLLCRIFNIKEMSEKLRNVYQIKINSINISRTCRYFSWILPCALKSYFHYVKILDEDVQ